MSISIIVLCYNDALTVPILVQHLHQVLTSLTDHFEILVVDDGSRDTIQEIPNARILRHNSNQGVGAAFRTGWRASQYDWVGYIDGHNQ